MGGKNTRIVTFRGETKSVAEWARELGVRWGTIDKRARMGWPLDERQKPPSRKPHATPKPGEPRAREHPLYKRWNQMRTRCHNPNVNNYKNYGARGIRVCDAWNNDFWQFVADMGEPPGPGYSLDRIDSTRGYEPGNVKWSDRTTQNRNRRTVERYTWEGETMTIPEWAERLGVKYGEMWARVYHYKGDMAKVMTSVVKLKKAG